jgi:hypothetical protein
VTCLSRAKTILGRCEGSRTLGRCEGSRTGETGFEAELWSCLQIATLGLLIWGISGQEIARASVRVVVPNSAESTEGGCACDYPFNVANGSNSLATSIRTQQIYPASQFSSLNGPMFITQIAFRPAAKTCGLFSTGAAFGPISFPVEISLSTTQTLADYPPYHSADRAERTEQCLTHRNPDHSMAFMNCFFDENRGLDSQVVFEGMLTLSSAGANVTTIDGTTAFDIIINLQHPFLYDPSKGNLLLDVKNFANPKTTFIDTVSSTSTHDVIFRIDADNVNLQRSDGFDELNAVGFVTRFQFDSQPISFTEYPIPTADSGPLGITAGRDGNLWFTESVGNKIGRISTDGVQIDEFLVPAPDSVPFGITAGPDFNMWFTEADANKIGKITMGGAITGEFSIPTPPRSAGRDHCRCGWQSVVYRERRK